MGVKQQIKNHWLSILVPFCVLFVSFSNICMQEDKLFVNGKNYCLNLEKNANYYFF